jgi:hypothetical protein
MDTKCAGLADVSYWIEHYGSLLTFTNLIQELLDHIIG